MNKKQDEIDKLQADLEAAKAMLAFSGEKAATENDPDSQQAQLSNLTKENTAMKKKLAETQKELNEAYARMSDIVQKKNSPLEELTV